MSEPIKKTEYLAYDAGSIKAQIISKLNEGNVFTDQNYEGSNISQVINVFSYTFDMMMYYLNKTSNETLFTETQLFENMVRLLKIVDYKPIGYHTSVLNFSLSATSSLSIGNYTIPRYSYLNLGDVSYSFNTDVSFTKSIAGAEELTTVSENVLLYQGKFVEYPIQTAQGLNNESFTLNVPDSVLIDHFNIHVYVKDATTSLWQEYSTVDNIYISAPNGKNFEVALNENKRYVIKFGDNVNGKRLNLNDTVAIYYLQSDGTNGLVGVGASDGKVPKLYVSDQFTEIVLDTLLKDNNILSAGLSYLNFKNEHISTDVKDVQTVSEMRQSVPSLYRSRYRLVTKEDYENYLTTNLRHILLDSKVLSNFDYINGYLKYFYNNGIENVTIESRILLSKLKFGTACNFNDVFVVAIPRTIVDNDRQFVNFLNNTQKNVIKQTLDRQKTLGAEIVVIDPIYHAISFGVDFGTPTITTVNNSVLRVELNTAEYFSVDFIKDSIATILFDYFNPNNFRLGQTVDINTINTAILNIKGIKKVYTVNGSDIYDGISLVSWNNIYNRSFSIINRNTTLEDFVFPYLFLTKEQLIAKIEI